MKNIISECRKNYEERKLKFNYFDRRYNKLKKPNWIKKNDDSRFECIYDEQELLINKGKIVYGRIVQANASLFQPGIFDSPAGIVFSEDYYFNEHVNQLSKVANSLYALKNKQIEDEKLKIFTDAITDETTALYNVQVPKLITSNIAVFYTTIMVHRKHLPARYLKLNWFPVLVLPTQTKAVMILPSKYWSKQLKKIWKI
ncbi:hypothetical protein JYG23_07980 [Sedimentibacter sp. zth1]|uniref:hypothetical protein n=1 Tax=Sedimentibacter sp. zth1 TaxID=2816908 RepID=UPI001A92C329|nr:hypothetical protein [Sedimentibacter sp. zth1]QSX04646.1 hypothetical protein JYG23_07980 [Sedimentibacter sp. zth1]